ncbi:hypothetical protein [Novosphingobium humi]|uniref:hypothetical protein n=1 Tax=Novosphingobium humi TaxID=2282397 RepID=UPI0025AFCCF5|nr:hypothetical protein [Novosphingobium humi]WJS98206.1 hypothetical protein NYQ05_13885 [Novosphingobium humi]
MAIWHLAETGESFDDTLPGETEAEARREIAAWHFKRDDFEWSGPSPEPSDG